MCCFYYKSSGKWRKRSRLWHQYIFSVLLQFSARFCLSKCVKLTFCFISLLFQSNCICSINVQGFLSHITKTVKRYEEKQLPLSITTLLLSDFAYKNFQTIFLQNFLRFHAMASDIKICIVFDQWTKGSRGKYFFKRVGVTYDSESCHTIRTKWCTFVKSIHPTDLQSLATINQVVSKEINTWHVNHRGRTVNDLSQVIDNDLYNHITMTKGGEMFAYMQLCGHYNWLGVHTNWIRKQNFTWCFIEGFN